MALDRETQRERFAQVGFLMRAYREAFSEPGRRRGLSQDELLQRMAEVDESYDRRFSHATVTRWESGATRPNVERLRIFGKALNLSEIEVDGLIMLAGLAPDGDTAGAEGDGSLLDSTPADQTVPSLDPIVVPNPSSVGRGEAKLPPLLNATLGFLAFRVLLPTLFVVASGYALGAMGWNDDWMPLAYLMITSLLVLAQAFVWTDRREALRDFYWASMFILLAFPAFRYALLGLDQYGFYRIGDLAGTHVPHMLMLLVAVVLSGLSAMVFQLLWAWQTSGPRAERSVLVRATWAVLPATLLSYGPVIVLSGTAVWVQSTVAMPILVGVLVSLLVIKDPKTNPDRAQCRFLLHAVFTIAIVASTLGAVTIAMVYWLPDLRMTLPDHNLMGPWRIDFDHLGYTPEQVMKRLDAGYMWYSMCVFAYMVAVVGGNLLIAVYRLENKTRMGPDAVHSEAPMDPPPARDNARSGLLRSLLPRLTLVAMSRR